MKTLLTFIILSAFCPVGMAEASSKRVTLGAILFPPNTRMEQTSGECIGLSIDVTRKILRKYQIELDVLCASPIRIYKLMANSEIDLTINIKSTQALRDYAHFSEKPYRQLTLNLYRYSSAPALNSVSAIRGFDYNGYRQKYLDMGVEFLDLPNAISAIQFFVKQQSDALLSYHSPVAFFLENDKLGFPEKVSMTPLLQVDTHYAIAVGSENFELLKSALQDYAKQQNINYYQDSVLAETQ